MLLEQVNVLWLLRIHLIITYFIKCHNISMDLISLYANIIDISILVFFWYDILCQHEFDGHPVHTAMQTSMWPHCVLTAWGLLDSLQSILWSPGPDSRKDPLVISSDTILWSWSVDRIPQTPITIAHQTEKIQNQTVYCQLNHDINHSLGNLELKLHGRDWIKTSDWLYLFMASQWEVWRRHLWVPIRERHGQFSARTQCLLTIYNTVWDMP